MTTTTARTRSPIDPDLLTALQKVLGGHAVTSGQPAYDQAVRLWNGLIDQRPALVVQPSGVADVIQAIRFAREHGLEIAIKGGGHSVAGLSATSGGLMIDLERMRGVRVDPERRTARVGGGARWSDLDRETAVFGLATTGGVISTTGVAGLTLGGGVGWLVGKHGLASDNLVSVDLVTADGEPVTASADSHPDLFWALRGGGGNFGVATSLEFQLHPQAMVYAGVVAHDPGRAREVIAFFRDFTATAPDELTIYCDFSRDPEEHQRVAALAFCWSGDMDQAESALAPLLSFGSPMLTIAEAMPYPAWNAASDAAFPTGRRYYWKSAMLRELDDAVLDAIAELGADPPSPWHSVTVENYTGAMNRRPADATAFPHRDAQYQVVIVGAWDDPAEDDAGRQWARDVHAAIRPYAKEGDFLNFTAADGGNRQERVQSAYGTNWDRLVEVKRRYDPDNVFHRNNNVSPA